MSRLTTSEKLDRFGYLDARYMASKPWLDERDALKKEIQEQHEDDPADRPVHLAGELYLVELSARANAQIVTSKAKAFAALRKAMGVQALVEALNYTMKLLDLHIPKAKQSAFLIVKQTGPRSISSVIKAPPEAA